MAPNPSMNRGKTCSARLRPRANSCKPFPDRLGARRCGSKQAFAFPFVFSLGAYCSLFCAAAIRACRRSRSGLADWGTPAFQTVFSPGGCTYRRIPGPLNRLISKMLRSGCDQHGVGCIPTTV
jgi:hypothetical protein